MNPPLIYLILGAAGTGRRELVADLIDGGLGPEDRPAVMVPDTEGETVALPRVSRWTMNGDAIDAAMPEDATHVFFITDGRRSPVDQVEAFTHWLTANGARIARVICVVDCRLAQTHSAVLGWYEACIHFSDVALLNHREGIDNKWFSDFLAHFRKQYVPCLFDYVKDGRVKNPALVLEPEARRLSQVFDEPDWEVEEEEDDDEEGTEEVEVSLKEDPYFARSDAGRRMKEVPDIRKYLP